MGTDAYDLLLQRLSHPDSELLRKILIMSVTPEEASFLALLPAPTPELATKFNMDEKAIEARLHDLKRRGLLTPSRHGFRFPRDCMILNDYQLSSSPQFIPQGLAQLWHEFYEAGWWRELASASVGGERPFFRVIPAEESVPDDVDLLPWENIRTMIDAAGSVAVRDCCCRTMVGGCKSPTHTCVQFNKRADYALERESCDEVSKAKALELALAAEDAGLVPTVANVASIEALEYICYCCGCCCIGLNPLKREGKFHEGVAPSRFRATIDADTCNGCQICFRRCKFDAVILEPVPDSPKRVKARIDSDKCFGCGQCVVKCKPGSARLELVRPPEHIPRPVMK